ncbi:MAG: OsmC family protein [Gilvibacter sp.]
MKQHQYKATITWTGNTGKGTKGYTSYSRDHSIEVAGKKHEILASSDPNFRGDPERYNPEDLFLSSLSACHMLWYLHLCSQNKIVVVAYKDKAQGTMKEQEDGSGKFSNVTLYPEVVIENADNIALANQLHHKANSMCFIANSCNFKIEHKPSCKAQ